MTYTKAHSQNAVAAKARRRIARATAEDAPARAPRQRIPVPRQARAAITIQLRDHEVGDSLTLTLHRSPFANHWFVGKASYSTATIINGVKHLLHAVAERHFPRPR
jgi:hypothetical protein